MIDLAQCHWVVDENGRLYLASAPSMRAPFRFDCFIDSHLAPRRLTHDEADAINQAAIEMGMRSMTFISSDEGIRFIQSLFEFSNEQARVA